MVNFANNQSRNLINNAIFVIIFYLKVFHFHTLFILPESVLVAYRDGWKDGESIVLHRYLRVSGPVQVVCNPILTLVGEYQGCGEQDDNPERPTIIVYTDICFVNL